MINVTDFLDQVSAVTKHQLKSVKPKLGFIDYEFQEELYPGRLPRVIIDGEGMSDVGYSCISSYLPMRGDRVVLFPVGQSFVILGTIDRSDRDMLQPGRLVFQARRTTNQNIASGSVVPVEWEQADMNLLGGWSTSNPSRYSPPVPGWYEFSGTATYSQSADGSFRDARWMLNGDEATPMGHSRVPSTGTNAAAAVVLRTRSFALNGTSDYVELAQVHNAGTTLTTNAVPHYQPHIEVKYVGPLDSGTSPTQLNLE